MGKSFPPKEIEAKSEAIDTLHRASESDEHVLRIVDECLIGERFPDPGDIRRIAYATRATEIKARPDCLTCGGIGFRVVERVVNGVKTSSAGKCNCWRPVTKATA
jgi:hypothetical protein